MMNLYNFINIWENKDNNFINWSDVSQTVKFLRQKRGFRTEAHTSRTSAYVAKIS